MQPFVPQIYSLGSRSRFWPYGTPYVRTPIPGAGFQGRKMHFETQALDLGNYVGEINIPFIPLTTLMTRQPATPPEPSPVAPAVSPWLWGGVAVGVLATVGGVIYAVRRKRRRR